MAAPSRSPPSPARPACLLLQALPFMLMLYLLFPRVSGPLWGLPQDAHAGLSGLSNQMSPGSISNLTLSGAIAFRSQFRRRDSGEGRPLLAWPGVRRVRRPHLARSRPAGRSPLPAPVIEARGTAQDYSSILEAHNQRWLLALDVATRLPPDSSLAPTLEALAREPVRVRSRFPLPRRSTTAPTVIEAPAILQQALTLPARINPRTRALADRVEVTATGANRRGRAGDVSQRGLPLHPAPPLLGANAIDEFLFDTRRGFCEHYASAFVFLMRAAGVPARVVAGYQGGELNPVDGYLVVRQSDAHAWAEIWLAGEGWRARRPDRRSRPVAHRTGHRRRAAGR
jgi:transglutaminase-like putative cysteine protease